MFKTFVFSILAAVFVGSFSGCSSFSPLTRSGQHPGTMSAMGPENRRLVLAGRIRTGMDRKAVYIAWGNPTKVFQGKIQGQPSEAWVYMRRPVLGSFSDVECDEYRSFVQGWATIDPYRLDDPGFFNPYYPYFFHPVPNYPVQVNRPPPPRPVKQVVFVDGVVRKFQVNREDTYYDETNQHLMN